MKPSSDKPRREGRESTTDTESDTAAARSTPSTDMQPEDAGTAASGGDGRGTAAENAMKQTGKTGNETGSRS